jgi:hypothetical protein
VTPSKPPWGVGIRPFQDHQQNRRRAGSRSRPLKVQLFKHLPLPGLPWQRPSRPATRAAGQNDTALGQATLVLAETVDVGVISGSGHVSVNRGLRAAQALDRARDEPAARRWGGLAAPWE